MKKVITGIFAAILVILSAVYAEKISCFITEKISNNNEYKTLNDYYSKKNGYMFVSINNEPTPYSYQDILDIIYTQINAHESTVTFNCPAVYNECMNDVDTILNDSLIFSHINNFVHPYNSFTDILPSVSYSGKVILEVKYMYNEDKIKIINDEVDKIINLNYKSSLNDYENIKQIHDYIINNTKYDVERNEKGKSPYESNNAYGAVISHYALCNGYTDLMAIILSKLGFDNYKIATTPDRISYKSTGHVWNAVYVDNSWLHLDLTWDDPVSSSGEDLLFHKYFLVNNEDLKKSDEGDVAIEEHNFDPSIYLEFNDSIKDVIPS